MLSGLAFLVACTCHNRLTRAEKKQLKEERASLIEQIEEKQQEAIIYEDLNTVMNIKNSEMVMRNRLYEINSLLCDKKAIDENAEQMNKLNSQMDSIQDLIRQSQIVNCVYGPPVDDPSYEQFHRDRRRNELLTELEKLENAIQRRENSCVYGSPEVMKRYKEETNRLKKEADVIRKQLSEFDNE